MPVARGVFGGVQLNPPFSLRAEFFLENVNRMHKLFREL